MVHIVDVIYYLSFLPFLGRQMISAAMPRSSQRHKCGRCGSKHEVSLQRIVQAPYGLLTDEGVQKLGMEQRGPTDIFFCCSDGCDGRLGIHTYAGDATNGDKAELVRLVSTLFRAVPDLISIPREKAETLTICDIHWQD